MPDGFLAIWSDVAVDEETDYLHWLAREHTAERLDVPGFLGVRVFRALAEEPRRYLILYRLTSPSVLGSEPYLARLNAPTPWSRRIMPILRNFARGGGRVVAETGQGEGAAALAIRLGPTDAEATRELLGRVSGIDRVAAVRLLEVDRAGTDIPTNEKAMRSSEGSFAALILVEALDDQGLAASEEELRAAIPNRPERYRQVFALARPHRG